jgi:sugar phosphate isomerase/epimerase
MYPPLPKSYKGLFPFKIGTTSFIYPDGYIPNVEALESTPANHLPTRAEISDLGRLAKKHQLTYNVHLPIDLHLGDENQSRRMAAVETIRQIFKRVAPLSPTTCTLHLIYDWRTCNETHLKIWQKNIYHSLSHLLNAGMNAEDITIENLNYPFEWLEPLLCDFNFRICLDFGHIFRYAQDADFIFDNFKERITLMHLNGFEGDRDHISLDRLSPVQLGQIIKALKQFTGSVSVEVFSFDDLKSSLGFLEKCWQDDR